MPVHSRSKRVPAQIRPLQSKLLSLIHLLVLGGVFQLLYLSFVRPGLLYCLSYLCSSQHVLPRLLAPISYGCVYEPHLRTKQQFLPASYFSSLLKFSIVSNLSLSLNSPGYHNTNMTMNITSQITKIRKYRHEISSMANGVT